MATYGWRKRAPVADGLFAEGYRFHFHQAVRLLEILFPERAPVGEGLAPEKEAVRFSSRVELGFPPGEVVEARPAGGEDQPARMQVSFLGLAGEVGPLPQSFTELILDRLRERDRSLADFLDLFNHRLVSFLYRARKKHTPVMTQRPPDEGRIAGCLFALIGLGTPHLLGRLRARDRALLFYTGLLSGSSRTMVGLTRMLSHYFGVRMEIEPFQGAWLAVAEDERTVLGTGKRGRNHELGRTAFAGSRVWNQQEGFELRLAPLSLKRFMDFLPTGRAFPSLCSLVRYYVGEELRFKVRLGILAGEVPPLELGRAGDVSLGLSARLSPGHAAAGTPGEISSPEPRLGAAGGARLGWTSWLSTRPPPADDTQVVLAGRAP